MVKRYLVLTRKNCRLLPDEDPRYKNVDPEELKKINKTLEAKIPWFDFIHARGKRYISLVSADFTEKIDGENNTIILRTPMHISLHSNIVQVDRFNDSFVEFVNRVRDKRKKFEQFSAEDRLVFWFKAVEEIDVDLNNCEFTICLLCEWTP